MAGYRNGMAEVTSGWVQLSPQRLVTSPGPQYESLRGAGNQLVIIYNLFKSTAIIAF